MSLRSANLPEEETCPRDQPSLRDYMDASSISQDYRPGLPAVVPAGLGTVLAAHGARDGEMEELLFYNRNHFDYSQADQVRFPLPDEACVATWETYAALVSQAGTVRAIYPYLAPLQFPLQRGVSELPEYRAALRRGEFTYPQGIATGLPLEAPERCRVLLHPTEAGRIPVIFPASRQDFVSLLCAFTKKNEPTAIPESMGAIIIGGFNNFHRIHALHAAYLAAGNPEARWSEAFAEIKQQKHLYQDRFILLSPGPYSGVPASDFNLDEPAWERISLALRLEHECTHYLTRRVFGSMRNTLLDELIADYCGLVKATGTYRADWALRFLGIDEQGVCREGGRLHNYRGDPPLSPGAFAVLVRLAQSAARHLERRYAATSTNQLSLLHFTLEELAET